MSEEEIKKQFKIFCELDGSVPVKTKEKYFKWFIELLKKIK